MRLFHKQIKDIVRFDLRYTYGCSRDAFVQYIVLKGGDTYGVSVKLRGDDADNRVEFEVGSNEIMKLAEICNRYKVTKWDGFHKSNRLVLDGNSFGLVIEAQDGVKVEAQGYMRYPNGYRMFRDEVDAMFEDWYRGLDGGVL